MFVINNMVLGDFAEKWIIGDRNLEVGSFERERLNPHSNTEEPCC